MSEPGVSTRRCWLTLLTLLARLCRRSRGKSGGIAAQPSQGLQPHNPRYPIRLIQHQKRYDVNPEQEKRACASLNWEVLLAAAQDCRSQIAAHLGFMMYHVPPPVSSLQPRSSH